MRSVGKSDVGHHRENNEDSIFVSNEPFGHLPNLFIVADGMGGHKGGAYASNCSIKTFCTYILSNQDCNLENEIDILELLKEGILYSNQKLYKESLGNDELKGMGTTFIVATIFGNKLYIANVGDSRLYLINDTITKITSDHSLVEEMVRTGNLSEQEAENHPNKNIITRAVGTEEFLEVDTYSITLSSSTYILLCSDGLTSMLHENEIQEVIYSGNSIEKIAQCLIDTSNQKGGYDNISVILIDWAEEEVTGPCCNQESF